MGRPKLAYVHLAACSGCEISFLDNFERLLDIMEMVDVEYMTLIMDAREAPKVDIVFVDGAACLQSREAVETLKKARENSSYLVAWGGCSTTATINNFCRGGQLPQPQHEAFPPISRLVKVDAFVPGSPPAPQMAYNVIKAFVEGDLDYLKYLSSYEVGGYACGCDLWKDIVENSLCIGCGACAMACPTRAITMEMGRPNVIFDRCVKCGACYAQCPRSFLPTAAIEGMMKRLMEE
ncbi:coenzyme F420 hydrogenase, subunit gamma [Methanocella conradii HZ254]|uniref:Coenzyme F420 hydrogenase subunit gamma n=1 Tax=Methanocella conradii (strain DSM 24694 / JCM 17849 / CGMCC 1.5162 / HZ254) TaxID=1041930 RepID=H8I5T8_METCZ|nr:coenzyme F420 hydrogenase subunit gamma [Methanocella conradii]AFC99755.1 coenzyme F420 hydrogenase, subunit gamma [Methanocella conradii HZ254]